jgi:hypothetical protein
MGQIYDLTHEENMSGHKGLATNRSKLSKELQKMHKRRKVHSILIEGA